MQDTNKVKEDILKFLENNGPSLPIKISQHIKTNSLFTSAFLSELLHDQKLKITNLKVGSSPVYFIPGTESGLEKFSEHLKSKEKEAFQLLKEKSFLEDETQEPAIRVALRSIPDFAKAFKYKEKIIWRYFLAPAQEYINRTNEDKQKEEKEPEKKEIETNPSQTTQIKKETTISNENINETPKENTKEEPKEEKIEIQSNKEKENNAEINFKNPLAQIPKNEKKEKPKSEFCQKITKIIEKNNWKIIEELEHKAKEYNALIKINSDLGPIIFKLQAKDKKTLTENDLSKLVGESQTIPLPALFMCNGEIKKKTKEFLEKYTSIIKYKKIE